jgi:hypothetical protein
LFAGKTAPRSLQDRPKTVPRPSNGTNVALIGQDLMGLDA